MDVDLLAPYFRMTMRTYSSWGDVHLCPLLSSVCSSKKSWGGQDSVGSGTVTADLNNHRSFRNNDPNFTLLIVRNVQARFSELEKVFERNS